MVTVSSSEHLSVAIVGHVDHGKSTLLGRLYADTGSLPEGKLEKVQAICKQQGKEFEYAFLFDAFLEEQEQGITIDTARTFFSWQGRQYIIIDAPGHKEFLKNMVSGAARADAAVLVIDAVEGVQEQSKRHGYLLSLLGIRQVAIIVNKMDLVDYSEDVYRAIETEYRRYLASINVTPERFVPASAKAGENIVASSPKMPWFTGPTVLDALGLFQKEVSPADAPLRLPLQDVYKFDARRILAGRVVAGTVSVGDRLVFSPSNKTASVRSIELFNIDPPPNRAIAGQSIGVTLDEQIFVERGEIASHETRAPLVGRTFRGNIFWMGKRPLSTTGTYILRLATGEAPCRVTAVHRIIDASELGVVDPNGIVNRNEVAEISIETRYPIAFDLYGDLASTGRFVLVDEYDVAGGGIVTEALDERAEDLPRERASESGQTTGELRQERFGHHAALIVIKGTEAARVTAVARQLETMLVGDGRLAYLLRPESLQPGIDRGESARRLDEVTRFLLDAGQIVIWPMSGDGEEEITTIRTLVRPAPAIVAHLTEAPGQLSEVDLWIGGAKSVDEAGDRLLHELQRSGLLAPAFNEPRRFRSLT